MAKKWDKSKKWKASGRIKNRGDFTQADLPAYLRDAERFGWETLDLTGTRIGTLPSSIGRLSNLYS